MIAGVGGVSIGYDEAREINSVTFGHGHVAAFVPLSAKSQTHKASTHVRRCLDNYGLNDLIQARPDKDAPACVEKIRKWRKVGDQYEFVDIGKAYLQVHIGPASQRYQAVVWHDNLYVMTRMGFGLAVELKFVDIVVR